MSTVKERVFVTGLGIVSSMGNSISAFQNALKAGQCAIKQSENYPMLSFPVLQAELQDFNFQDALTHIANLPTQLNVKIKENIRRYPKIIEAGLIAALAAWSDSNLFNHAIDTTRIGIIVAGENTTQHYQYQLLQTLQNSLDYLAPSYALYFMDTNLVGVVSEMLNIHGPGCTVGGASASGNVGIIQGLQWVQHNLVDICVVIGAMADLSPLELQGFYNLGALGGQRFSKTPALACRPFDSQHEGFIPGQASACVILEAEKSIKKRQVRNYGEILSGVSLLDGNRLSDARLNGEARVMQTALHQAKLQPASVDYINTHGTSTPLGDKIEIAAIKEVFGQAVGKIWLNATKGLTGHCLWSAGVVEAVATLLQMQENFLHPNLNLDQPIDNDCCWVRRQPQPAEITIAMSNAFGFGGFNSSLIFQKSIRDDYIA